jgi:hypothetical protein
MPGPCDHICATGTEEQCSACLISQYNGAVTAAMKSNFLTEDESEGLLAVFNGLMMKRNPGRSGVGNESQRGPFA